MRRDARAYLWDIQRAADAILKFTAGLDVETYAETEVVHSAVERKFEIIGEALGQLAKLDPLLAEQQLVARGIKWGSPASEEREPRSAQPQMDRAQIDDQKRQAAPERRRMDALEGY